ncbi:hypothetical protein [Sphingomonas sp.]|nr:hypothetical protein [Sphingomonas sp.]
MVMAGAAIELDLAGRLELRTGGGTGVRGPADGQDDLPPRA